MHDPSMKMLYVQDRSEWRAWLERNGKSCDEIWLVYYKKSSGKPRIGYEEAVEEALCFGWIDSIIKSIDGACYAQKFTPRKARSHWSNLNIQRAQKLIASGKMTEDGLQAFKPERQRAAPAAASELPDELEHHFRVNVTAWEHFSRFPAFYRRMTIQWVASAKKDTTRRKRLAQLIEFSARNERIKFM